MKTYAPKKDDIAEKWYVVDAKDQILGRLAARIAAVLRGKRLPTFTPYANMQTHVIVVNADKVRLTGKKLKTKTYYRHTLYPGGIRSATAEQLLQKKPTELMRHAVRGMIPHNRLGNATMKRLRIYAEPTHPHQAQNPEPLPLVTRKVREEK
jgi:large subunit ribosomal protein L13